jgi:predicted alpha/beta-hydrolase family hydrolase
VKATSLKFEASKSSGKVSALLLKPESARWLLVFAHGAGAGMRHAFMEAISERLAGQGIATFRYQFPYTEKGSKRPDPKGILLSTVRSAIAKAIEVADGLPLLAGGKSMGGRMTSTALAEEPNEQVKGIIFFGFPLHPPGAPSTGRAAHLSDVQQPMLFLQGTRDPLADLALLKPVCKQLGRMATLHIIDGADHSFHVLKSSGRSDGEALDEMAATVQNWAERLW